MPTDSAAISPWTVLPFVLLLTAIALGPLLFETWWARHYPKLACGLGVVPLAYYLVGLRASARVLDVAHEYLGFIVLIGALFVISGGIHIQVRGEATPAKNVLFLFAGALLANVLGTTGASMVLIRPWIRMNQYRVTAHHIVFFIFIISNVGGCLTPIGDPPLFLGYLEGIPFWWVTRNCGPMWLVAIVFLLFAFYLVDQRNYRRAPAELQAEVAARNEAWTFNGLQNCLWLAVVLAAVFVKKPPFLREALMLCAAAGSWFTTVKAVHQANHFDFHPFREVAILFLGLFATMMPALDLVQANAHKLAHPTPALFYWGCGLLSSVLDNAPTYLTFLNATLGLNPAADLTGGPAQSPAAVLVQIGSLTPFLLAISVSAVFFGANTYIGNAPNFMVRSIARQQKVHTPNFLGFIFKYTLPVMAPLLVLIWLLFFR